MTITLGWWFWPALLFVVGLVVATIDYLWDGSSGGDYGSIGQGCVGACICAACWLLALGLVVGRWLA